MTMGDVLVVFACILSFPLGILVARRLRKLGVVVVSILLLLIAAIPWLSAFAAYAISLIAIEQGAREAVDAAQVQEFREKALSIATNVFAYPMVSTVFFGLVVGVILFRTRKKTAAGNSN